MQTNSKFVELIHPVTKLKTLWPVGKTGKPKLVLSNSTQNTFSSCEHKAFLSNFFLSPSWNSSHAADCGTAIHEAFQRYLREIQNPSPLASKFSIPNIAILELFKFYPWLSAENKNASTRQFEDLTGTLIQLMYHFENLLPNDYANSTLCLLDGKPTTEIKFEIFIEQSILPEFDVYIAGAMDMGMYAPLIETYTVWDIKTHQNRNEGLLQIKYENDNQCIPYHWVLTHVTNREIDRFQICYLTAFIHASEPKVQFIPYTKTRQHVEDYMLSFAKLLHRIKMSLDIENWTRHSSGCVAFNSPCALIDICRIRGNETRHMEMRQDYILGSEEPYFRYESEEMKPDVSLTLDLH